VSDVLIVRGKEKMAHFDTLYINGEPLPMVVEFDLIWKVFTVYPMLKVERYKGAGVGDLYTADGHSVARTTEYYPVHSLEVRDAD